MSAIPYRCNDAFVALGAVNFDDVLRFYRQFLELEPQVYLEDVYAEFQLAGMKLGIFKPKASHETEFSESNRAGLSLCLEVDELDGAIAHITQLGYPPPGNITTASHGREVYVYDPAGNRIILHESVKQRGQAKRLIR